MFCFCAEPWLCSYNTAGMHEWHNPGMSGGSDTSYIPCKGARPLWPHWRTGPQWRRHGWCGRWWRSWWTDSPPAGWFPLTDWRPLPLQFSAGTNSHLSTRDQGHDVKQNSFVLLQILWKRTVIYLCQVASSQRTGLWITVTWQLLVNSSEVSAY